MALSNNKIDVIIPAYNVNEHILMRCLSSIACQSILEGLINLYVYYLEVYTWAKDHLENNFKWCKLFYNEIYKDIENNVSKEKFEAVYSEIMIATYKSDTMNRIVPHITIYQFLEMLKK